MEARQKILIVEDETITKEVIARYFEKHGYDVYKATNGKEALLKLEQNQVDVILSDIIMPKMNGYQFRKKLLENKKWAMIPFVFLTSLSGADAKILGFQLNTDAYLTKPISPEEIFECVSAMLGRRAEFVQAFEIEKTGKLEEIAKTVSHEINNPLQIIIGYLEILRQQEKSTSPHHELYLKWVEDAALRIKYFVKSFDQDIRKP